MQPHLAILPIDGERRAEGGTALFAIAEKAQAALAAAKQGKHQPLHNALMEFTGKLDRDKILEIAVGVGIDRAQLEKDMEDPKIKAIIDRNLALASALGVRGTPAFVIGKQFVPGAVDAAALKQLIAEARKSQG